MSFTKKKFFSLSFPNKIKKQIFALREFLAGKKAESYCRELIQWFNESENENVIIPNSIHDWGILIHQLEQRLPEVPELKEAALFDQPGNKRTVFPLKIILDNIRSPFNSGSIIRSGEALGIEEIILAGITPGLENKKVLRSSRDVQLPISKIQNITDKIKQLASQGYRVYSLEKNSRSIPIYQVRFQFPAVLITGNEEFGISDTILELSHEIVHIPLFGNKNSLNVSVAAGIALYEITKKIDLISP